MQVFVISLTRSIERRIRVKEALQRVNISFDFFDAQDATQADFLYSNKRNDKRSIRRLGYKLTNAEIACFASHYALWEKCVELGEPVVVLEDSVELHADIQQHFDKLHALVTKYQYFKICSMFEKKSTLIEPLSQSESIIYYADRTCGTQGYVISPYAAQCFINNASHFIEPVDNYMEKPWLHGLPTYNFHPSLVARANIASTIGRTRKVKKKKDLFTKCIIESFRSYEYIQYKIRFWLKKWAKE